MRGERRVVITGLGVVSPLGNDLTTLTESLKSGRSAGRLIQSFDTEGFPVRIAAEVLDFDARKMVRNRKAIKMMARDVQFGAAAAGMAVEDSGFEDAKVDPTRLGTSFGAGYIDSDPDELAPVVVAGKTDDGFDMTRFGQTLMSGLFPLWMLKYLPNMPACHISITHDAQGPSNSHTSGDSVGLAALGEAARIIERGAADVMICGGCECQINPVSMVTLHLLNRASRRNDDPAGASRPFERSRDGILVGEAAASLILEELEHARRRGAKIYGEVLGYGSGCDAWRVDQVHPEGRGCRVAMRAALRDAGLSPREIGYVAASGVSGVVEDRAETIAIKQVFASAAKSVPVSAVKSMTGHPGAAGGALDVLCALLAMKEGFIPPTINFEEPDPECDLDYVPNQPRPARAGTVLVNGFGLGGQASSLVVGTWRE